MALRARKIANEVVLILCDKVGAGGELGIGPGRLLCGAVPGWAASASSDERGGCI